MTGKVPRSRHYGGVLALSGPVVTIPLAGAALAKAESGWPASVAVAIAATPADRLIAVSIAARAVPRRLATGRVICVVGRGKAGWPSTVRPSCSGSPERQCG